MKTEIKKGDNITIQNNSILEMMGLNRASGKVLLVTNESVLFNCTETSSIESVDLGDGLLTINNSIGED